jgi:hypothetical protein
MRQVELSVGATMNENLELGGGRPDDPDSIKTRRGKGRRLDGLYHEGDKPMPKTLWRLDYFTRSKAALDVSPL